MGSESHVDSLKTVLDIMQDEGSLDSSHGPHTCVCSLHKASSLGKLKVPVVLLPYVPSSTGVKINFTLSSPQGCFSWSVYLLCVCRGGRILV